jgi:putative DNA methylase
MIQSMPTDENFQPGKEAHPKLRWYARGYIPHFDGGEIPQFLTFRLFDSMPQTLLQQWREEAGTQGEKGKMIFRRKVEKYLDRGYGECFLQEARVAEIVQNSLLFYHEIKYSLQAWVVMPNHIHFLAMPLQNIELREIAHSIKSYTAHQANKLLNRKGQFWQHEPFDRYIRNEKHFVNVIKYIENNPVKAGLCEKPEDWQFSSAFYSLKKL